MPLPLLAASVVPAAAGGSGFLSALGGLSGLMGPIGGLLGGFMNHREVQATRDNINQMAEFNPMGFAGPLGNVSWSGGAGRFHQGQELQALQGLLGMGGAGLLTGGLFNDPNLQSALSQNDISGALGQANSALSQQANPFFNQGQFQNIANQSNALGGMFANQAMQGPQDFSGGMQGNLFQQGAANMSQAGNQQGLYNQFLDTQRQAATNGGLLDQAINKFQDRGFSTGRAGTTGGMLDQTSFLNALAQQDLGFQNNAFGLAQNQQSLLGGLGAQQMGLGSQLMGQNLGQYNQNAANAQGFLGMGAGLEGQGFQQQLAALGQNQSAGLQRLQAAQGLFGLGSDVFSQQYGLGLGAQQGLLNQGNFGLNNVLGLGHLETSRIGATGNHAYAQSQLTQNSGGLLGNLLGGLF